MKKISPMTTAELSSFCLELSLLLHAAYPIGEGLHLLFEESKSPVVGLLCEKVDDGMPLARALEESGAFPSYLCRMAQTGEDTGRLEEAFAALSVYYENRRQLSRRIRSAIFYPATLLLLMLVVVTVLLTKVLPIFHQVFQQLGGGMSGLAGGLLRFGQQLDAALPVLAVVLLLLVCAIAAAISLPNWRSALNGFWQKTFGDRGLARKISAARFSAALSMGLKSGLSLESALGTAATMQQEHPALAARMTHCIEQLESGTPLAEALVDVLPVTYCRMLALGMRSGSGDEVMAEIARRMEAEAEEGIETVVSRVEPAMVLLTSLLVGVILLSVMLPLMNIMSAIG